MEMRLLPVVAVAYAGAAITQANPMKTAFISTKSAIDTCNSKRPHPIEQVQIVRTAQKHPCVGKM